MLTLSQKCEILKDCTYSLLYPFGTDLASRNLLVSDVQFSRVAYSRLMTKLFWKQICRWQALFEVFCQWPTCICSISTLLQEEIHRTHVSHPPLPPPPHLFNIVFCFNTYRGLMRQFGLCPWTRITTWNVTTVRWVDSFLGAKWKKYYFKKKQNTQVSWELSRSATDPQVKFLQQLLTAGKCPT